ncbi:hypothetical protein B0H11DRAFT_2075009 [Mycena galericulata]|nr:hypothetical protein B0H11DRAFT_2075009 [Mycena galericulata]
MDVLMLSLFVADLIQAIGAVMDLHWVHSGRVDIGAFCTAQGVVQQLGETSVAITTLMITLFTFVGVWFRKGLGATFTATILIALVWIFVILLVGIGNADHRALTGPTPYWCWISQEFLGLRLAGEYVWLWITLGASVVAYLLLFFWARGNITVSEDSWWRFAVHRSSADAVDRGRRRNSYTMIAYPVCYSVLVLPLSVVRWIGFTQADRTIPSAATFAVISVYGLSGALNVALLLNTRPNSVLFGDGGIHTDAGRAPSPVGTTVSDFRARNNRSRGSSLQLGRLPSASDGAWDLPRTKDVVHRNHDDDSTVDTSV